MFHVQTVHPDWYADGIDNDENLWRLDFAVNGNEYQAQLFLKLGIPEDELAKCFDGPIPYTSARLFLERDNRLPGGDGERIDYACECWTIEAPRALGLLAVSKDEAVAAMGDQIRHVEALPNDRVFIRKHGTRRELAVVEAYWAGRDAATNKPEGSVPATFDASTREFLERMAGTAGNGLTAIPVDMLQATMARVRELEDTLRREKLTTERANDIIAKRSGEILALQARLDPLQALRDEFQELNMRNYNEDDVALLNDWGCRVYAALTPEEKP